MGKPSRSQPAHADIDAAASVRSPHRRRPRSKTVSRQRDSVTLPIKLPVPSASVSPSEPPSPSPLTELMDEEFYDATDEFPDEDGDLFYESYQGVEHKPALATVQQVIPEPEYDGAAKGRCDRGRTATHSRHMAPASTPTPAAPPAFSFPSTFLSPAPPPGPAPIPTRGPMKTTVNLTSGPVATTLAHEEARKAVPQLPIFQRKPVKKALVVGMNYASWGKDGRLYYAVKDAKLWRDTFVGKGVESDNIKIITDEGDVQDAPTFENLLNHIRWLVSGATSGDSLFFVYSGHAVKHQNYGPSIMTADKRIFPRPVLERELVMSIPAGVDLQVVFDCCHSAGMIGLQFCVGRMVKPTLPSDSHAEESATCPPEHESQTALPRQNFLGSPQHASLYGLPAADAALPPRPPPVTPETVEQDTFGAPPQRPPRGGVVAAPPMAAPAPAAGTQTGAAMGGAVRFLGSLIGIGSSVPTPAPAAAPPPLPPPSELPTARPGPRRACQGVVEGARIPDYFEERKEGFVAPAGKVMVWAGTGEAQKAFESYGGVRQGVVTKAMCAAFERITTRRDLWSYLVQEIESENTLRSNRDANKSISERPLPSSRIQHAELWVSQAHVTTLRSAAPVLDQPII